EGPASAGPLSLQGLASGGLLRARRFQPLQQHRERHRAAGMIALDDVATHAPKLIQYLLALDAFGDHLAPQRMGELDGGVDHDAVALRVAKHGDEAAVDLDLRSGNAPQI